MQAVQLVAQQTSVRSGRRRGSETRQKELRVSVRVTAAEYAEIAEAANREGLTMASYARKRLLAAPTDRKYRRPTIEVQALARLQGEVNRVGTNIHQLLKHIRFGGTPAGDEIMAAFAGYREVIAAILTTLGRVAR